MKASKTMLCYLLVTLLTCCLMPGLAFGDGPWDIDYNGNSQTSGGSQFINDRNAVISSSDPDSGGDETGGDGPTLVTVITYNWLRQIGLTNLAESIIVKGYRSRVKDSRSTSKTRR